MEGWLKLKCSFCNKRKSKEDVYEGMKGNLCKDCLAVLNGNAGIPQESGITTKKPLKDSRISKVSINKLKSEIDKVVMGQEEAKRQLIIEFYKHYQNINKEASNIFIVGDSGVGKTHLVRSLSDLLDVPFLETDATVYTEAGYKGRDVTEMLDDLVAQEMGSTKRLEQSIIFIDEIDKITTTTNSHGSGSKVQESLLKIIEGIDYNYSIHTNKGKITGTIDTSKIMFVLAGACVGLSDIRRDRTNPNHSFIGFSSQGSVTANNNTQEYASEDLIEYGFIPEFIGRCSLIVELFPLTKENMYDLLLNSPNSLLNEAVELFRKENIRLIIDDLDVEWLVDESFNSPLGVRCIPQILTKQLNKRLYDSVENNLSEVRLNLTESEKALDFGEYHY